MSVTLKKSLCALGVTSFCLIEPIKHLHENDKDRECNRWITIDTFSINTVWTDQAIEQSKAWSGGKVTKESALIQQVLIDTEH